MTRPPKYVWDLPKVEKDSTTGRRLLEDYAAALDELKECATTRRGNVATARVKVRAIRRALYWRWLLDDLTADELAEAVEHRATIEELYAREERA